MSDTNEDDVTEIPITKHMEFKFGKPQEKKFVPVQDELEEINPAEVQIPNPGLCMMLALAEALEDCIGMLRNESECGLPEDCADSCDDCPVSRLKAYEQLIAGVYADKGVAYIIGRISEG